MLRANAVDERYLTSYTAYRTSGGLAPGGELRHAASGSEMCFCIHPRSASAHVRTPPISGAHFSPLYCTTGYHHNTQHTTHNTPNKTKPTHRGQQNTNNKKHNHNTNHQNQTKTHNKTPHKPKKTGKTKKACGLPDGESNPGHPRDRRVY